MTPSSNSRDKGQQEAPPTTRQRAKKPFGLWLAQGYLLFLVLVATRLVSKHPLATLIPIGVLLAAIGAMQMRTKWAYALVVAVFAIVAAGGIRIVMTGSAMPNPDEPGSYQVAFIMARWGMCLFVLTMAGYVAFGRSSRAYFGLRVKERDGA